MNEHERCLRELANEKAHSSKIYAELVAIRGELADVKRERDEAQLRLAVLGDIAVGNWDDSTVGEVDSVVKEPRRYKDALRVLFVDNPKTIAQLRSNNARLQEDSELLEWLLAGNVVVTKSQMATGLFYKPTRAEIVASRDALVQTEAKP